MNKTEKHLLFVDFQEIYEVSELKKKPILRILYDMYIPRKANVLANGPTIIFQKAKERFVIYC